MDIIQRFLRLSADERKELLYDAIRRKCKYPISENRLNFITARLNLHRPYLIKVTSDHNKFLNITTSEHIETEGRILLSQVFPLYGQFTPGFFVKTDKEAFTPVRSTMDVKQEAAAVKIALNFLNGSMVSMTYTLVLYELKRNKL